MYAKRVPFTRDNKKGPQPVGKATKKATTPKPEPAKIEVEAEVVDLIIEEPMAEETVEEPTDGNA
jgi:hypothetical protein